MTPKGYGFGNNIHRLSSLSMQEAFVRAWGPGSTTCPLTVKLVLMLSEYMHRNYHGRYIQKRRICGCCCAVPMTEALEKFDALVMPTIPFTASRSRRPMRR